MQKSLSSLLSDTVSGVLIDLCALLREVFVIGEVEVDEEVEEEDAEEEDTEEDDDREDGGRETEVLSSGGIEELLLSLELEIIEEEEPAVEEEKPEGRARSRGWGSSRCWSNGATMEMI